MKIRIPRFYDRVMDWIAFHLLPPDKPTGLRLFGHAVTWLELALVAYPTVGAIALFLWSGNWLWFPAIVGSMALAVVVMGWR
jgi:hypothetical protein